jgi:chemotaxis protein histidine kinase CheA
MSVEQQLSEHLQRMQKHMEDSLAEKMQTQNAQFEAKVNATVQQQVQAALGGAIAESMQGVSNAINALANKPQQPPVVNVAAPVAPANVAHPAEARAPQPPKPEPFTGGTTQQVDQWIFHIDNYFDATRMSDTYAKSKFARACMSEAALAWIMEWNTSAINNGQRLNWTWEEMKVKLIERFRPIAVSTTARHKIWNIKQENTETVNEFCQRFLNLNSMLEGTAEVDRVYLFTNGLKKAIAVRVDEQQPTTLNEVMSIAQKIEARWESSNSRHKESNDKQPNKSTNNKGQQVKQNNNSQKNNSAHAAHAQRVQSHSTGVAPMQLDNIMCYVCKNKGHKAADCPLKQRALKWMSVDEVGTLLAEKQQEERQVPLIENEAHHDEAPSDRL